MEYEDCTCSCWQGFVFLRFSQPISEFTSWKWNASWLNLLLGALVAAILDASPDSEHDCLHEWNPVVCQDSYPSVIFLSRITPYEKKPLRPSRGFVDISFRRLQIWLVASQTQQCHLPQHAKICNAVTVSLVIVDHSLIWWNGRLFWYLQRATGIMCVYVYESWVHPREESIHMMITAMDRMLVATD